jgi:hypothetical protein
MGGWLKMLSRRQRHWESFWPNQAEATERQSLTSKQSLTDWQGPRRVHTIAKPFESRFEMTLNVVRLIHSEMTTRGSWDQKYINVDGCDFYIQ